MEAQFVEDSYGHLLDKKQEQMQMFQTFQRQEIEQVNDFKNHNQDLQL